MEIATLFNCLMCNSVFFITVLEYNPALLRISENERKNRDFVDEWLAHVQELVHGVADPMLWVRCPTCQELHTGLPYQQWVSDLEQPCCFSPCVLVRFERNELAPVYGNVNSSSGGGGGRPKWLLKQGVGPPTVELDRSRSNQAYLPALIPYLPSFPTKAEHMKQVERLRALPTAEVQRIHQHLSASLVEEDWLQAHGTVPTNSDESSSSSSSNNTAGSVAQENQLQQVQKLQPRAIQGYNYASTLLYTLRSIQALHQPAAPCMDSVVQLLQRNKPLYLHWQQLDE